MKTFTAAWFVNCIMNKIHNYYYLRWLADIMEDKKKTAEVCCAVALFFVEEKNIYHFLDLFVVDNIVFIYTNRPSYWIGKGGGCVERLRKKLNYNVNGEKINDYDIHFIEPKGTNYQGIITAAGLYSQYL